MHFIVFSKYFYSKLGHLEKTVYDKILAGWLNYKSNIKIIGNYARCDFQKVFESLRDDIPELFYIDFNSICVSMLSYQVTVSVHLLYTKNECEDIKSKILSVLSKFEYKNKSLIDIERDIHDYLAINIKYSNDINSENAHNIFGALIQKTAVCEGYARAFKLICDKVNLPCIVVMGAAQNADGRRELHAWNIVSVAKKRYHVDVTWDSSLYQYSKTPLYYNVSDDFISKDHTWIKDKWPVCKDKGEIENDIIDVIGNKSFEQSLKNMATLKKTTFILRFNKKFNSSSDIMALITKALHNLAINDVVSYSASYISKLDCAIVWFNY